ncbi:hypothetical protein [Aquimarina sp. MMG016]|uniref:hypothetical protein n=1 Tax=Aquimarina sp. MMG016 TaxID=2822690 RepID=UPI001B3A3E3A|nr:hypothetical protein [Aquimarina sp. MMG016]MBQ4822591.1 hypothetical protein [Aquimarina sp. MMG016]
MQTSDTKKTWFRILVIFSCIILLFTSFTFFKDRYLHKKEAKENIIRAKKDVIRDLDYQYAKLKSLARYWSTIYAKVTAVHNRDTIEHPNYTVEGLTRRHNDILSFFDQYEEDPYLMYYVTEREQLSEIYPIGDTLRYLFNTYRLKEKIPQYVASLNMAYTGIMNHVKKTDSISRYKLIYDPKFSSYFYYLDKIDRVLYELLFEQYPQSLHYLINETKEFEKEAVGRLIYRQTQELNRPWPHPDTSEIERLRNHMEGVLEIEEDSLTNYIIKKNGNKLLLLVKTSQISKDASEKSKKEYLNALYEGVNSIKDAQIDEVYLYVEIVNTETLFVDDVWIKTPLQIYFDPYVPDDLPRLLSGFYTVDAFKYYIKGSFSLQNAWYPNRE